MANTLYDVLEVIPTASAETIHAAYRSLIQRYHPDKVAGLGPELQAVASARTKEINFAYDVLSDAESRARYDEELLGDEMPPEPASSPRIPLGEDPGAGARDLARPGFSPPEFRPEPAFREPVARETGARPLIPAVNGPADRESEARAPAVKGTAKRPPATRTPAAARARGAVRAGDAPPLDRRPLATLAAAVAGIALILALPPAANVIFGAVEFSLTGHARFFYDAENPVDARGDFGSAYLPVLWGWLFANYLLGLVSYRLAVFTGETAAAQLGGSFAATNDRLFLFLTFVCVVAVAELFFSAHTMGNMLAGMFMLAGAYLAERGIT